MPKPRPQQDSGFAMQPFRLLDLRVDPGSGRIEGDGEQQHVDPRCMAVLQALAARPGQLVTRDELFDEVWQDRVVSDETLTQCVFQLRKHLAAAGDNPRYRKLIVTLPKRGYQLECEVHPDLGQTDQGMFLSSGKRLKLTLFAALFLLLVVVGGGYQILHRLNTAGFVPPADHAIAVLPFVDFSPDGDQAYLAEGIADELIDRFTRIQGLRVIARTSSFSFRDENVDIPEIAKKLGVSFVLEGSVRKDKDRIRITTQLIDTGSNSHLWSESYDRQLTDILDIQSDIARAVTDALQLTLAGSADHTPAQIDGQAYDHYQLGQFFFNRRASGDVERSEQHYRKAVEIDPDFAQAWVGLAAVYWLRAEDRAQMAIWIEKMGTALEQALKLDPEQPEAHARAAAYYASIGDEDQRERHWRLAQQLGPEDNLIVNYAAAHALDAGDYQRVVELSRKAVQQDPLSAIAHSNHGFYLLADGQFQAAQAAFAQAEQFNPEMTMHHAMQRTLILVLTSAHEQAVARAQAWPEGPDRDQILAHSYHALGQHQAAKAAEQRLLSRSDGDSALRMAEIEAVRGDADAAFAWLEQIHLRETAAEKSSVWPRWDERVRLAPSLRGLRNDPRWEQVMQNLPQYQPLDMADGRLDFGVSQN